MIRLLAKAKARQAPEERRAKVAAAWAARWWSLLSIAARNTLAATLADDKPKALDGFDGEEPLWHEVLLDGALEPQTQQGGGRGETRGTNEAGGDGPPTIGRAL